MRGLVAVDERNGAREACVVVAEEREVVVRGEQIIPLDGDARVLPGETPERMVCRFRTLGCSPCTGAVRSEAQTVEDIIAEMMTVRISERSTRIIDHDQEGSMEIKKREGYF